MAPGHQGNWPPRLFTSFTMISFILPIILIPGAFSQIQSGIGSGVGMGGMDLNSGVGANIQPDINSQVFTGTGNNPFYGVNLVPFGPDVGDHKVHPGLLTAGQTVDLHMWFPFYGGFYNYTTVSFINLKVE